MSQNAFLSRAFDRLLEVGRFFSDYLVPSVCLSCRTILAPNHDSILCLLCLEKLSDLSDPNCSVCAEPFTNSELKNHLCGNCLVRPPSFEKAGSVFLFEDPIRKLIHDLKYAGKDSALAWFAVQMKNYLCKHWPEYQPDFLVPVPLHRLRLMRRGYNQALKLCYELNHFLNVPIDFWSLSRSDYETSQVSKSRLEREQAMRDVFVLKKSDHFYEKKVLLIDDVYTTGATARACALVLKRAGAMVRILTIARTPKGENK